MHEGLREQTDFAKLESANTKLLLGTGFALPQERLADVIERDFAVYEAKCASGSWRMVTGAQSLRDVMKGSLRGILFHIEGFPGFEDLSGAERWYVRGLRSAGLVWNDDNPLGGGTNSQNGITPLGREFIAWCESRKILIDLAHTNPVMFKEALASTTRPVFISHGGLMSAAPSKRNFTDEQVAAVVSRGGIFGVFFPKSAMSTGPAFSVDVIAEHIKSGINLFGEDAIALGTDFGGMISGTPAGLESVDKIAALWSALESAGLTASQIEKIAHGNALRYLLEQLPTE